MPVESGPSRRDFANASCCRLVLAWKLSISFWDMRDQLSSTTAARALFTRFCAAVSSRSMRVELDMPAYSDVVRGVSLVLCSDAGNAVVQR
jgi:hypothetical protein